MINPLAILKRSMTRLANAIREFNHGQIILHREYERIKNEMSTRTPDNPALFGYKVYSQFDEDGIVAHIFSRIGSGNKVFVEIGCSDGLENNTHALLLQGWRGAWVDADSHKIQSISKQLPASPRLVLKRNFVSIENVNEIVSSALSSLRAESVDFLSIDIDGDDLNVLTALVSNVKPRVICAEYNAKFPPPIQVAVKSGQAGFWTGDDYHGASLSSFECALRPHGYRLVTCGISGANAFFVNEREASQFPAISADQVFRPALFDFRRMKSGHPPSLKFLANELSGEKNMRA